MISHNKYLICSYEQGAAHHWSSKVVVGPEEYSEDVYVCVVGCSNNVGA